MTLYPLYKYLIYIPFMVAWTALNFFGVALVAPFSQQAASRWFGGMWGRGLLRMVPAKLHIQGMHHMDRHQPYILVANHLSLIDIPILYGWLPLDLKWVMKKELRRVPFIGPGCALMGHIFLDRSNSEAAVRELQSLKTNLQPGTSILFFPEGTRSRDGKLQRFKLGAFHMAKDLDMPVLPITIRHAYEILPPDNMDLRPGRAEMVIHPPIKLEQVQALSAEELRDEARRIVCSGLGQE